MQDDLELLRALANCEDKEQMMRCIQGHEAKTTPLPFYCPVCGHKTHMPMSNADRIRAMSDEELCSFMSSFNICDTRSNQECKFVFLADCQQCLLEWLQQPADDKSDSPMGNADKTN